MKPTSSYKMGKEIKVMLINIQNPHLRGVVGRAMIVADLESKVKVAPRKNQKVQEEVVAE